MRLRTFTHRIPLLAALMVVPGIILASGSAHANPVVLDRVVAVVNDDIILESELYEAIFGDPRFQQALQNAGIEPDPALVDAKIRELRPTILDDLIHRKLVLAEAERFQIEATEADVDRYLENLVAANGMGTVDELRKDVAELLKDAAKGLRRPKHFVETESGRMNAAIIVVPTRMATMVPP